MAVAGVLTAAAAAAAALAAAVAAAATGTDALVACAELPYIQLVYRQSVVPRQTKQGHLTDNSFQLAQAAAGHLLPCCLVCGHQPGFQQLWFQSESALALHQAEAALSAQLSCELLSLEHQRQLLQTWPSCPCLPSDSVQAEQL